MTVFDRFKTLGTSVVSDVLDEGGFHAQTLDPQLAPVGPAVRFCGPAVCVRGERRVTTRSQAAEGCFLPLYALPQVAHAGAVLIFAVGGFRGGAVLGGLLATDIAEEGAVGVVTDGLVRDREELSETNLPVHAAGSTPTNGARRLQISDWQTTVSMPGIEGSTVLIQPGDIVIGDADGVVVVPQAAADRVLNMAEELAQKEVLIRQKQGEMTSAQRAHARAERVSHVVWLRKNKELTQ